MDNHTLLSAPCFDAQFRAQLRDLFVWRRDVRRFRTDPIDEQTMDRLIASACLAPSVGLSQPWRFVRVDAPARREAVIGNFRRCNAEALKTYEADDASRYARLKLAGLEEAPRHLAVFADEETALGRGLGVRTMPEMSRYSVVAAICNLWLAARSEGVGVGWVSILDPSEVKAALEVPEQWTLIGYFCLGVPESEDDTPELERQAWESRQDPAQYTIRR